MMAERLTSRALVTQDRSPRDRKLRIRIIIANAIAWVAILILIDLFLM